MDYTDLLVVIFSGMIIMFIVFACYLLIYFIFDLYYSTYATKESIEEPVPVEEKRYVYVIFGQDQPSKYKKPFPEVRCKYIESDTKLTYQELKDKFPSIEIMGI